MTDLEIAIYARNEFLADHPELQSFQDELTETFMNFGNDPDENLDIILQTIQQKTNKILAIREAMNVTTKS